MLYLGNAMGGKCREPRPLPKAQLRSKRLLSSLRFNAMEQE